MATGKLRAGWDKLRQAIEPATPSVPRQVVQSNRNRLRELYPDVPSVSHADLATAQGVEAGDHSADLARVLYQRVPEARQRVGQTVGASAPQVPEAAKSTGIDLLESLALRDSDLYVALTSLGMVCSLIRESHSRQRRDPSVLACAGFDQENLYKLLEASLGSIKGAPVPRKNINKYLISRVDRPDVISRIFYDFLDLRDDSTPDEIRAKCDEFKKKMDRFDDLIAFPSVEDVEQLLEARTEEGNANVATADLAKDRGFDSSKPIRFDEAVIENIFTETLYQEVASRPAGILLNRLWQAFRAQADEFERDYRNQYFNGDDLVTVVSNLDDLFVSDVTVGLGSQLASVSLNSGHAIGLLREIAGRFKTNGPEALRQRLVEVCDRIHSKYPNLSSAAVVAPAPAPVAPSTPAPAPVAPSTPAPAGKVSIDYKALCQEMMASPDSAAAYPPFYHLFYALRRSEEDYDTKDRTQLFGGESRAAVMSDIDMVAGNGMGGILQKASREASADDYLTALIQAIAKHFKLTDKPGELKAKLVEIGSRLGELYPRLKTL